MDAAQGLATLQEERNRAAARISNLEAEWRAAQASVAQASAALAEVERHGGSATTRHKAEKALSEAQALAGQPWAERVEGARRGARDSDAAIRAHTAANLPELVEEVEERGQEVADRINASLASIVADHGELEHIAAELGRLLTAVSVPGSMDVSRSESEQVARAAAAVIGAGGEVGPRVSRVNAPWATLLGQTVAA
jgi:hypothetical protein